MILIPQMDCIVVHPTLAASLQLPEALFLKCTCIPPPPPNAHASAVFRFFAFTSSSYDWRNYETVICGWRLTLISFTGEGKRMAFLHAQNTMCQRIAGEGEGWRRELRTRWVCDVHGRVRSRVRMREQRVTWWAKKRASFQKKQGGSREKKGRFARNSTSFYSASPHSRKTKHFSHKTFDYSKLNPYFYAW